MEIFDSIMWYTMCGLLFSFTFPLITLCQIIWLCAGGTEASLERATGDIFDENGYFLNDPVLKRLKRDTAFRTSGGIRRSPYTDGEKRQLLNIHNEMRSQTKNAGNMKMLEWDSDLEREAQRWADRCDFRHPTQRRKVGRFEGIGQNLYVATAESKLVTYPIQSWYDEIVDYTYSTRACTPGKMCGHYTQIVWANTEAVGCAIQYCDTLTSVKSFNVGYFVVCEYGPPGNYRDQHPYVLNKKACGNCTKDFKYCVRGLCSVRPFIGSTAIILRSSTAFLVMSFIAATATFTRLS